jgi:hypothetical protein
MKIKEETEYERFTDLTDKVLSISREEMKRRLENYRNLSLQNANRRGPKPKSKPSAPDSGEAS